MERKLTFSVNETKYGRKTGFEVIGHYKGVDGEDREWFVTTIMRENEFDYDAQAKALRIKDALEKTYDFGHNDGYAVGAKDTREIFEI